MVDRLTLNVRKPESNEYGEQVLERMNRSHNELALWALSKTDISNSKAILDIGCGGGKNISNMLSLAPDARVFGIDYSEASVAKSVSLNSDAVASGRTEVHLGNASELPYVDGEFDFVTAFETVYYWENIVDCFKGVRRILAEGGRFLICNEDCDNKGIEEASAALGMTLFTADELGDLLARAGFSDIEVYAHENTRWVCAIGTK